MVKFVEYHGVQSAILGEAVLHLEVALLMQFIGSNPNIGSLGKRGIRALGQFLIQAAKHLRCHHCFT